MSETQKALWGLAVLLGLSGWLIGVRFAEWGMHRLLAFPAGALSILSFAILIVVIFHKESRRNLVCLLRFLLREFQSVDFAAARRITNRSGNTFQTGSLTVWTDSTDDLKAVLDETSEELQREFYDVTGLPAEWTRPLRMLSFRHDDDFRAYSVGFWPKLGRVRGFYSGLFKKRMVISREASEYVPSNFKHVIAHEMTHHLLRSSLRRTQAPWLEEGITSLLAERISKPASDEATVARYLRAELDRSGLFSAEKLFSISFREIHEYLAQWEQLEHASFVGQVYNQSFGFVVFLLERFEKEFHSFLAELRNTPRRKMNALFRQCFHLSANEVHQRWIAQLSTTPLPPHCKPPRWVQETIESELVPLIVTQGEAANDQRRIAIRSISNLGYPWSADILVELAEDDLDVMQAEAHRALENLAGRSFENSHQAIRTWWESLTADVKEIR